MSQKLCSVTKLTGVEQRWRTIIYMPYTAANITGVENCSNREREAASLCVSLSLFGDWALIGGNLHNFMARPVSCHNRDATFGHAKMLGQNFN